VPRHDPHHAHVHRAAAGGAAPSSRIRRRRVLRLRAHGARGARARARRASRGDPAMQYATLSIERRGEHVLVARLNRPEVLNALDTQMGRELLDLWTRLAAAPGETRCVVLTGA